MPIIQSQQQTSMMKNIANYFSTMFSGDTAGATTPKIENRTFSYQGNICVLSAALNIYTGATIVASTQISASYDISQPDFIDEITRQLNVMSLAFITQLSQVDGYRQSLFPDTTDFVGVTNEIFDAIEAEL